MRIKKIKIDEIVIGNRIRKDIGDIEELAISIKQYGLLNYPIISADNRLITGCRRIQAAKLLGWKEITVRQSDKKYNDYICVEVEIAENVSRKDFSKSERIYCGMILEEHEKIKAEERMKSGKSDPCQKSDGGRVDDIVAKKLGISRDTYRKEKSIYLLHGTRARLPQIKPTI